MGSRYLSAASVIQLAVLTAMLALSLNLITGLSAHETRLYRLYGDRVFSVRAVVAKSGSLYRFDQLDMIALRDGLRGEGIAVAGFNLSYIDAREVTPAADGTPARSHQPPTSIALVDATPLYFDITGIPVGLAGIDSGVSTLSEAAYVAGSEVYAPDGGVYTLSSQAYGPSSEAYVQSQDTYMQSGNAHPCVISRELASRLFERDSSVGRSLTVSGGKQLFIVDEATDEYLLPIVEEPTPAGLVHRPERFVIYRPALDLAASGSYGYLLFEIQANTSLIDGMKAVSHFLTINYPGLQSDVYSEYERFAEQSVLTRSALTIVITAVFIGYAIAGACMYAEMQGALSAGREMVVRMTFGATPRSIAALMVRRALATGALAGCAGCVLYLVTSAVGVSVPELPPENIGIGALPAVAGAVTAVLTALVAAVSPVKKVLTLGAPADSGQSCTVWV